jgi:hypothetical protein
MSAKNKTILFVFSMSAVLVTEGTVTLVTLPLGLTTIVNIYDTDSKTTQSEYQNIFTQFR